VVIMVFDPDTLAALCAMPFWFGLLWIVWRVKARKAQALRAISSS